jgi:hypothetical protein
MNNPQPIKGLHLTTLNMKKQNNTQISKISEKFDKQLLAILSDELNSLREAKNHIIKKLTPQPNGLQVA